MIQVIVGAVAAGFVISGFIIGFVLIVESIAKDIRKNNGKNR